MCPSSVKSPPFSRVLSLSHILFSCQHQYRNSLNGLCWSFVVNTTGSETLFAAVTMDDRDLILLCSSSLSLLCDFIFLVAKG